MRFVRTIKGDIDPSKLGITYSHEHLYSKPPYWVSGKDEDLVVDDTAKIVNEIKMFIDAGGNSIIEGTAIDYGRDVLKLKEIADNVDINIVCTTGFNKGLYYEKWVHEMPMEEMVELMIKEVMEGYKDTGIKCGQIKIGTSYNTITPTEEKVIRAAAKAQNYTKAPMYAHTEIGTMALEQIEILRQEGIDLTHVAFGHMDRNPDMWYYLKIAETGAYLIFDGLGKVKYYPESVRINSIIELCKKGYQKKIMISGDMARKSYYIEYGGGPGLTFILTKWVPRFIEEANSQGLNGKEIIEDLLINNPREFFSFRV
ncbi:phosphotriesterase family protein [Calorimonas adulescens]|uniref:Phosphotriesterase n=1 Tax=Calorimonas adulescens TaxID=2606906 RepID=A0A5D8QEN0_9THEO|nr:phosphotriesterase [Calorimonas adulescens]TZE82961.1 phosphotriesterase [Calorimonas adulescens]